MATVIGSECIQCAACAQECPNEAIRAVGSAFIILRDQCTECVGFFGQEKCQEVCPVECCRPDPEEPETEAELAERALRLHPDDDRLRARIEANDFPSRFRR